MIDPEIFFDQRPSHPTRPLALEIAHQAERAMWDERDAFLEEMHATEKLDYPMLLEMEKAAVYLLRHTAVEYDAWMASYQREPSQYEEHAGAFLP